MCRTRELLPRSCCSALTVVGPRVSCCCSPTRPKAGGVALLSHWTLCCWHTAVLGAAEVLLLLLLLKRYCLPWVWVCPIAQVQMTVQAAGSRDSFGSAAVATESAGNHSVHTSV